MTDTTPAADGHHPSAARRARRALDRRLATRGPASSGPATGKAIAQRNLIFSVLSEHIGFSVWSLWSVLVLFLGPDYGFDPAQKFLLTALPTLVGAVLRMPYTFAVGDVRRPELDDRLRPAAAGADDPDRDLPQARASRSAPC